MGMGAILVNGLLHFSNLSCPQPYEAPYEIWKKLAWQLQRRSCLKILMDWGMDAQADGQSTNKKVITIVQVS